LTQRGLRIGAALLQATARAEAMISGASSKTAVEIDSIELSRSALMLDQAGTAISDACACSELAARLRPCFRSSIEMTAELVSKSKVALAECRHLLKDIP
jgi:hypothetical protein